MKFHAVLIWAIGVNIKDIAKEKDTSSMCTL